LNFVFQVVCLCFAFSAAIFASDKSTGCNPENFARLVKKETVEQQPFDWKNVQGIHVNRAKTLFTPVQAEEVWKVIKQTGGIDTDSHAASTLLGHLPREAERKIRGYLNEKVAWVRNNVGPRHQIAHVTLFIRTEESVNEEAIKGHDHSGPLSYQREAITIFKTEIGERIIFPGIELSLGDEISFTAEQKHWQPNTNQPRLVIGVAIGFKGDTGVPPAPMYFPRGWNPLK